MFRTAIRSAALCLCAGLAAIAQADDASLTEALDSISTAELKQHIEFLASDTLQGREAGTQGNHAAGAFLVSKLKPTALRPAGDEGDWFQYFNGNMRNIIAIYEGSDEKLKQEFVLVGAHYDHVGFGTPQNSRGPIGYVHNGADDNASGCAAVLEVIDACMKLKTRPRRSVLFVFWDGEEKGLLGSRFFLSRPTRPLAQIRCVLNADMVGRLRDPGLQLQGWRSGIGLRAFLTDHNRDALRLDFTNRFVADSDHWPFFEAGIPAVMLHTGKHDDYHRPSDDTELINMKGVKEAARFLARLTWATANGDELPKHRADSKEELASLNEQALKPVPQWEPIAPPARLGISFDLKLAESRRVRITDIKPGSSAAEAGLKVDDEVLTLGGHAVRDWADFRSLVMTAPMKTQVRVRRDKQELDLPLKLTGEPVVLGIKYRDDPAEPGTVIITRVVDASPAFLAGLKPGQRIRRVADRPVTTLEDFSQQLDSLRGPFAIQIEEDGQQRQLEVTPIR